MEQLAFVRFYGEPPQKTMEMGRKQRKETRKMGRRKDIE
jgi:hypothetical protein